jgi:NADPH-dependent 2,4-dienoyl-CoA reductase/sulfur reductase-like enzyme
VAAETLRDEGFGGRLTLLEMEPTGPVDRPNLSKEYLAGNAPEEWIPLRPDDFYRKREIELRVEHRVEAIDPKSRTITVADGEELEWDALLLATGAAPAKLSIPGAQLPHVFTLRGLRDAHGIIGTSERSRRAVVVGASFIGLEVAASLRARELQVHVVAPESTPMEGVLGPDLGTFVRELHEEKGVRFHLGRTLESIELDHVILSDGSRIDAELVVVGIGVQPRTELAEAAGIRCDDGVLVNELLETSLPGIWAAGDVARWPDRHTGEFVRVEHWVVAEQLGRTAARNILGAKERFRAVPFFWSRHYDASVHYVGSAVQWEDAAPVGDPRHGKGAVLLRKGGRTLAVASVGDPRVSLEAELALETGDPAEIDDWERRLRARF